MDHVTIGNVQLSRLILGSNPFSGFSHQTPAKDLAKVRILLDGWCYLA